MKSNAAYYSLSAFLMLSALSCGNNPDVSGPEEPHSDFDVFIPDEDTTWQLWQLSSFLLYDYMAIEESNYVWVEIVRGDSLVVPIGDSLRNVTGSHRLESQIPAECGMGDGFRVRLCTAEGDTAYSAEFSIDKYFTGTFVEAPAGSFTMGSDEEELWHQADEMPVHTVTFTSPFEIMETEVCQRIWVNVMGNNPSSFNYDSDSLPVEFVSWLDCKEFIDSLNALDPYYAYRLPSEAEWEYACRSGSESLFYWGEEWSSDTVSDYAWYSYNSGNRTHKIASIEPNQWGLYDMNGNVCEWCEDVDHDDYTGAPTDGNSWVTGGNQGYRIQRGGGWSSQVQFLKSANRSSLSEQTRSISCGLRLIREPK